MQIPEALEWRDVRLGRVRDLPRRLAFVLNVLQPVAAYAAVHAVTKTHDTLSVACVTAYATSFLTGHIGDSIRPRKGCPHMVLDWWPLRRAVLYNLTTLVVLRRLPDFVLNAVIFEGTLAFALMTVKPCAVASVWCWSTFVAATCYWVLRRT